MLVRYRYCTSMYLRCMLVLYEYVPVPEMYAGLAALGLLGGLRLVRLTGLQTKYKSVVSRSSVVDPGPY